MKQVREFIATGQAAQAAVDKVTKKYALRPGSKDGKTRGQAYRDQRRERGFVYVTMWVHSDDADSVRAYGRRKNEARFRGKSGAGRVTPEASGTR